MYKKGYIGWTPSDLIKAAKDSKVKNFSLFADKSERFLNHPSRIFRGLDWEPETPESILPSYLAVKRPKRLDRKEWNYFCKKF